MPGKSISYEAYQQMAAYYAHEVNVKPYNAYYERPAIIALLPDVKGLSILDAGCGAGFLSHWAAAHGAVQVLGLDLSENMLAYAKENAEAVEQFRLHNLNEPLQFIPSISIDLVLSSLTLHYLENLDAVFLEFFRILKAGGRMVFSIHHPAMILDMHQLDNYFQFQLLKDWWNTPTGKVEVSHYHRPLRDYASSINKAGFLIEMIEEPLPLPIVQEISEKDYAILSTKPRFLFFRIVKPGL